MTTIIAGPYEFVKHEFDAANFEKQTLCIMSDNRISQRQYKQSGKLVKQVIIKQSDYSKALSFLEKLI